MKIDTPIDGTNLSTMLKDMPDTPYSYLIAYWSNKGQIRIRKPIGKAIIQKQCKDG
jgi:hypothetical protein